MNEIFRSTAEQESITGLSFRYLSNPGANGPVIFLVHGRAGDSSVMWAFSKSFRHLNPRLVIAPQAYAPDPIGGYSWWPVFSSPEERGSIEDPERKIFYGIEVLERFIFASCRLFAVEPSGAIGMGFSQGAGAISGLSLKTPVLFSRIALLAGFVPGACLRHFEEKRKHNADSGRICQGSGLPNYFFAHGSLDQVIPLEKALKCAGSLREAGAEVSFHTGDTAHKIGTDGMRALSSWLEGQGQ